MLVERADVLDAAERALVAASEGDGGVLIVTGPPGVGRSAVLDAIVEAGSRSATAAAVVALRADATLTERDFDFGVIQQLIRPLVVNASDEQNRLWFAGPARVARPMFLGEEGSETVPAGIVLPALHSLITSVAAERTLLLAVDDLQWTDQESLRWLACLSRRAAGSRVLVVVTIAEGYPMVAASLVAGIESSASQVLRLEPLSVAGVQAVAAAEFDVDCAEKFARACHSVTAGNPAALLAVLRGLRTIGVRPVAAEARTVVDQSDVLLRERRLFYLGVQPGAVLAVARALVVLAEEATWDLIARVADLDSLDCTNALQVLDRAGLLEAAEPRQLLPSLRAAVEAAMTFDERELLCRRAAIALHDAGYPATQVADRLVHITSGHDRWETDVLRSAASVTLDGGHGEQAVRYLRSALMAGPVTGRERASLLVDLAVGERGLDPLVAVGHIAQALPELPASAEKAAALLAVPFALAERNLLVAMELRGNAENPDAALTSAHQDLAWRLEARGRAIEDDNPFRLQAAAARLADFDGAWPVDTGGGRELMAVLAHAVTMTASRPAATVAALGEAVFEREEPNPAYVYTALPRLVAMMVAAGAAPVAGRWLEQVWHLAYQHESAGVRVAVNADRSTVACAVGAIAQARSLALEVLDSATEAWPQATVTAAITLTHIALRTQDVGLAERVLKIEGEVSDPQLALAHLVLSGMLDALRGDLVGGLDKMLECGDRAASHGWTTPALLPWRVWAASLHQRLGDGDSALALAGSELEAASAWGAPHVVGRALHLRGRLLAREEGDVVLRAAVDRLRDGDDVIELACALVTLAGQAGADAEQLTAEANRIVQERGVGWADDASELTGPVPRLLASGRMALSATEQNVAKFVVQGWTNQRIADSLGVTRRAVEKSLTGVYRKLGVSGRTALIDRWNSHFP